MCPNMQNEDTLLKSELEKCYDSFLKDFLVLQAYHRDSEEHMINEQRRFIGDIDKKLEIATLEAREKGETQILLDQVKGKPKKVTFTFEEMDVMSKAISEALKVTEKYPKLVKTMSLVYAVALLEVFISESTRSVMSYKKEIIKSSKQVTFETILEFKDLNDLHVYLIDRELMELGYKSFEGQCSYFEKRLGIDFSKAPTGSDEVNEICMTRNLLLHNKGIVSRAYKEAFPKSVLNIGDERLITNEYLETSFDKIKIMTSFIHEALLVKFCSDYSSE